MPKREKARILAAMQQSTQNRGHQRAMATELDDQPRLLAAVLRAHMETCEFTREKVASMRQRARECPSYSLPTMVSCFCFSHFSFQIDVLLKRPTNRKCQMQWISKPFFLLKHSFDLDWFSINRIIYKNCFEFEACLECMQNIEIELIN